LLPLLLTTQFLPCIFFCLLTHMRFMIPAFSPTSPICSVD
jgi:hypothetical protein